MRAISAIPISVPLGTEGLTHVALDQLSPRFIRTQHDCAGGLASMLYDLGITVLQAASGDLWFYLGGSDVHEHERWLLHVDKRDWRRTKSWLDMPFTPIELCSSHVGQAKHQKVVDHINDIFAWCSIVQGPAMHTRRLVDPVLAKRLLRIKRTYGHQGLHGIGDAHEQMSVAWSAQTHEFLCHHETWAARHDVDDLPVNLLARMEGLKGITTLPPQRAEVVV